ncbi:MAG: MBL fold metallo-hydrolase [Xanthobacteraceae bacterium]|nr:MBL fold metallo-hydrolase [Xanthobacteraceae bacterium]
MSRWQYRKGLHDIGHGCFAYLQPDGSWGWSNAGLVTDGDQTLLVDTLFDLPLTAAMLKTMREAVPAARKIGKLVNTHANGDHTFGNQLVEGAEIIACRECAKEFAEAPPSMLVAFETGWKTLGDGGAFFHEVMGSRFDWRGVVPTPPTTLFDKTMEVTVGDKRLHLTHLGSAHTRGDILVHVPADRVLYTGDLLFAGGHPVIWEGPIGNWIKACDYILGLDVDVIVPGHGPISEKPAVRELKSYFEYIAREARTHFDNGVPAGVAAEKISLDRFAWLDPERIVINVASLYREFSGSKEPLSRIALFAAMKKYRAAHAHAHAGHAHSHVPR